MKAQSLKNAILQLAVQGKLVPQNPQDEPASELLKKIQAEKAKLIKEKKIKAEKPLASITDEEKPFDIPDGWEWVRLGAVIYNFGQKKPDENFYYIDVGSINNAIGVVGDCSNIEPQNAPSRARKLVEDGCVIYSTVRPYLLNIAIVDNKDGKELIASTAFAIMQPFTGLYNKYLYHYLRSRAFVDYVNSQMIGVAYPAINDEKLFNGLLPLPPLAEQQRIVEKIKQLMPLVENYDRYEKELSALEAKFPDNLKKSVLQLAVQGKLVPQNSTDEPASELLKKITAEKAKLIKEKKIKAEKPLAPITDEEKPFDIPDSWKWVRLGGVATNIHYGFTASALEKGNSKLLRITDIQENKVDWSAVPYCETTEKEFITYGLQNRDIMIARTGGTIGKSYIVKNLVEKSVFASYLIRIIPPTNISDEYLKIFLGSPCYWVQLKAKSMGTGQPNVNGTSLSELCIPLPPLAEQQRIVEKVQQMLSLCDVLADESKLKKHQPPKRLAKVIEFIPVETENEHEHLSAARADEISPETRTKQQERLALLRKKR